MLYLLICVLLVMDRCMRGFDDTPLFSNVVNNAEVFDTLYKAPPGSVSLSVRLSRV